MTIVLGRPGVSELDEALGALRRWQDDGAVIQLHPGDIGWFWRFGAAATAAAVRTWSREGRVLAVGLLDGPRLLRLTTAPDARRDEELARRLVSDVSDPESGVLMPGRASVEAPPDALVQDLLRDDGWGTDAPFTPLRRDLTQPVPDPGVRIEVVEPERAPERTAVQRAAFGGSTFTDERWHAMAAGPLYAHARDLLAYDDDGAAVAAVTVWSAGPGRPGLLEPVGVHREHRGRGYGTAISVAAAAALHALGSSSAIVCTPSSNVAAVATYKAAGFQQLPERLLDQLADRVDVGHGVVVGQQPEVDLAVVAHDRDGQRVVLRQEGDRHDLLHLAPEQVERELRARHVRDDQVEEPRGEVQPRSLGEQRRPWSTDQAALRFYTANLMLMDIMSSITLERAPRLQRYHDTVIPGVFTKESRTKGQTVGPIFMDEFVGLHNWIVRVIGEVDIEEWVLIDDEQALLIRRCRTRTPVGNQWHTA
jgi:ribosomal protein S18 acetylase RimI-like enzyme